MGHSVLKGLKSRHFDSAREFIVALDEPVPTGVSAMRDIAAAADRWVSPLGQPLWVKLRRTGTSRHSRSTSNSGKVYDKPTQLGHTPQYVVSRRSSEL